MGKPWGRRTLGLLNMGKNGRAWPRAAVRGQVGDTFSSRECRIRDIRAKAVQDVPL